MDARVARWLLWLIALLPMLLAVMALPAGSFDDAASSLRALGRLTAIAGLGLFLVAAIVSFRIPGIDRWFGGLTRLWRSHHFMGGVAFLLLLAHPLLLALAMVEQSLNTAVALLFPSSGGLAIWTGWGSLIAMMVFLAPSFAFFGDPDYQRWKWLHRLSGVAALLALAHTFMLAATVSAPGGVAVWLVVVWLVLAALAVASMVFSLVLMRRGARYHYRVSAVAQPANNVVELTLAPLGKSLRYQPGQFVYLTACDPGLSAGRGEEHPYTLSSAPDEPALRVAIKDLGDASRAIQYVAVGSEVTITGPYGAFFPSADTAAVHELWIAGGIGVTPFLGRARQLAKASAAVDIQMIYCVQDEARALFAAELTQLATQIPGFHLTLHYFYQHGPLSADFLGYHCRDVPSRQAYVCGPGPLLKLSQKLLLAAGLPRRQYHSEEFNLL